MEETKLKSSEPAIKRGWLRAVLSIVAFLVAIIFIQGIVGVVIASVKGANLLELKNLMSNPQNFGIIFILQLSNLFTVFLVVFIFRKYIDRKSILSMGFHTKNRYKDMLWGMAVGFVLMLIGFFVLKWSHHLEITAVQYSSKAVFGGFLFFILVAFGEEILFRGYILPNFMDSFKNKYMALFISSVLFAVFHGLYPNLTIVGFINLLLAGIALGITYIHTQNLWFPIFLHLSWNYFQGPVFGFEVSGLDFNTVIMHDVSGNEWITGGKFGFEGSVIISVLLIAMIIVTDRFMLKSKSQITQ